MKIYNKILISILLALISFNTGIAAPESLKEKAEHFIKIASQHPDSSILISKEILRNTSDENKQVKGLAFYALGEGFYYKQEYDSAFNSYKKALNYFIEANDTAYLASTYNNIGLIHFFKADYGKALDAYLASLNLEKRSNNLLGVAKSHQNIGLIYSRWGRTRQELEHYNIALEIYKQLNDTNSIANMENNLGVTYVRQNNYKKALMHYKKAYSLFSKLNDQSGKASALTNIGNVYIYQNKLNSAIDYLNRALAIFSGINDKRGLIHIYSALGETYAKKGDKNKAIQYYLKSEEINKSLGFKQAQKNNLENLYESYKAIGDYKNASRILEKVLALKDSIFDEEKFAVLADLEKKYDLQKSKQEALLYKAKNEKQKVLLTGIIIFFIFVLIIIFILHKNKTLKDKQQRSALEQKVLRTQMNPHFIFNTLSAIQCMVLDNRVKEANEYLTEFSKLIRKVLQYSMEEKITLKQEKELLLSYFNLQNRRFNNQIRFNIVSDDDISDEKTLIPPMLSQPFIENALEHGHLTDFSNSVITLSFHRKKDKLIFSIEDNGIGINKTLKPHPDDSHKSMAIQITRERLRLINSGENGSFVDLKIIDLKNENMHGTRIEFYIPFEEMSATVS